MNENIRRFEVADPSGRTWQVEFRWQQNAISIRHCDSVDCKYYISNGLESREMVVALMHPDLLRVAGARGRELSDAWCLRLAALHMRHMISTWEDMEQSIAVVAPDNLEKYSLQIEASDKAERERLAHTR